MRHGAGPLSHAHNLNAEIVNSSSVDMPVNDANGKHRLGCYFCSDVVAPTDVISLRHCVIFELMHYNRCSFLAALCVIFELMYYNEFIMAFCSRHPTALWTNNVQ